MNHCKMSFTLLICASDCTILFHFLFVNEIFQKYVSLIPTRNSVLKELNPFRALSKPYISVPTTLSDFKSTVGMLKSVGQILFT